MMSSIVPSPSKPANQMSTNQLFTNPELIETTVKNGSDKNGDILTTMHPDRTTDYTNTSTTSKPTTARHGDRGPASDGSFSAIPLVPNDVSVSESSQKSQGTTATTTEALVATITVPKLDLKNITLDLDPDFDLVYLTNEQRKNLDALSNAYGLNPDSDQVSIDARMKEALQVVAATMPPEVRELVGFPLKDLVSSCIINGKPCDRNSDFELTFDVDYGNCYTFNGGAPVKYITRRSGASYGLRMTIISNISEQLPSTAEEGVKIVVHGQEKMPFPNVHGYKSSPGRLASHILTYSKISRLGTPYGQCSTNDSVAANGQPFYYNGSYSMEGCFRSCFQRNVAKACGCADARFPTPTDMNVPFCDPLEPIKYKCLQAYIKMKGDYYFVDNCNCYEPCEVTRYKSQIAEGIWPSGGFFYGPYCPMAKQLNFSDCSRFYSENGMVLEVSFAQLGYELLEEEPLCTLWCLINNLAGNTGFWVGYTMISFSECILIAAQVLLWIFRCPWELPEVPSCRRRNFFADHEEEGRDEDESCALGRFSGKFSPPPSPPVRDGSMVPPGGPLAALRRRSSALPRHILPPRNFDNCFGVTTITPQEIRALVASGMELYRNESPYESVNPVAAHSTQYADRTIVE
ncbi:degenerin unc-8 [Aphelenchoides avenae]|nr:degenerin unc-8 [Aphelenchus avenae]